MGSLRRAEPVVLKEAPHEAGGVDLEGDRAERGHEREERLAARPGVPATGDAILDDVGVTAASGVGDAIDVRADGLDPRALTAAVQLRPARLRDRGAVL